jgi:acyl carrier protein
MGLDTVELVMKVENHFEIEIPNAEAAKLATVGALHGYVVAELRRQGRFGGNTEEVYGQLRHIICRQLGVRPELVLPAARFVEDLGAD